MTCERAGGAVTLPAPSWHSSCRVLNLNLCCRGTGCPPVPPVPPVPTTSTKDRGDRGDRGVTQNTKNGGLWCSHIFCLKKLTDPPCPAARRLCKSFPWPVLPAAGGRRRNGACSFTTPNSLCCRCSHVCYDTVPRSCSLIFLSNLADPTPCPPCLPCL